MNNKYIVSTTGSKISFNLSSTRTLVIDPIVPTQVEEMEFRVLESRLGSQIKSIGVNTSTKKEEPEVVVIEAKVVNVDNDGEIIGEIPETRTTPETSNKKEDVEDEVEVKETV